MVEADAASGSLYSGVDGWIGQKFGAGVSLDRMFTTSDRLNVSVMQPLNISGGSSMATVPVGRDLDGNVLYESHEFSVDSDAVPLELGVSYVDAGAVIQRGIALTAEDSDVRNGDNLNFSLVASLKLPF
jgi:hypothetical protein